MSLKLVHLTHKHRNSSTDPIKGMARLGFEYSSSVESPNGRDYIFLNVKVPEGWNGYPDFEESDVPPALMVPLKTDEREQLTKEWEKEKFSEPPRIRRWAKVFYEGRPVTLIDIENVDWASCPDLQTVGDKPAANTWIGCLEDGELIFGIREGQIRKVIHYNGQARVYEVLSERASALSKDLLLNLGYKRIIGGDDFLSAPEFAATLLRSHEYEDLFDTLAKEFDPVMVVNQANAILGGYRVLYPNPSFSTWIGYLEEEAFYLMNSFRV